MTEEELKEIEENLDNLLAHAVAYASGPDTYLWEKSVERLIAEVRKLSVECQHEYITAQPIPGHPGAGFTAICRKCGKPPKSNYCVHTLVVFSNATSHATHFECSKCGYLPC